MNPFNLFKRTKRKPVASTQLPIKSDTDYPYHSYDNDFASTVVNMAILRSLSSSNDSHDSSSSYDSSSSSDGGGSCSCD